ncbi:4-carboxymuconolactone decarboxylase [Trinickia symbiotica]|uniref:4-carboxymuconolactone decarboxylase n=1 Tax=Trinickia symbiotica TaxID=863227 RepID=A0A2N7WL78_9BURK|nr:carboxymuconolactone decarboxylase family protein [Trinickia symbiotica]PMS30101.1 4-carboxymuconolactone decarboxylase [Trinickia symbiotica]PPK41095.1 4-carboxymuconolactone decarboxylase [Trinickia symbiotica]
MEKQLFEKGLAVRRELLGDAAVEQVFQSAGEFGRPMQELVTSFCWGAIWTRPELDRRSRSILNLGMLAAANRSDELAGHVRIALRNGLTRSEIRECFLQAAVYLGMPVGLGCFKIAAQVFAQLDQGKDE